jgi:N-acetylmuramoyl-L-alanine amidase/Zinc carboxypeptidase
MARRSQPPAGSRPHRGRAARAAALAAAAAAAAAGTACGASGPPASATQAAATPATAAAPEAATTGAAAAPAAAAGLRRETVGRSRGGRPIEAITLGAPDAPRTVLVVGVVHGDEPAGARVVDRLARARPPAGVRLVLVRTVNPDGLAAGTRTNARGVDLNRNSDWNWRERQRGTRYWSGPQPWSEPESRAVQRLTERLQPTVAVWYHQPYGVVDDSHGTRAIARRYARRAGLPLTRLPKYPGSLVNWQNAVVPGITSFVVEFGASRPADAAIARHARAVQALMTDLAPGRAAAAAPPSLEPPIREELIPFGARRRAEMADYARRHYGLDSWRLARPRLIVEHVASAPSADSVREIFRVDRADPSLHERPNVCAHYVVGRDGAILHLVPLGTMCRHVVGLNYTAIGIEHAGFSDADVMGNEAELRASLRLTRWLRCRFAIPVASVIGHGESLGSPFYRERVAAFRGQTHTDMSRPAMSRYRAALARLPCPRARAGAPAAGD